MKASFGWAAAALFSLSLTVTDQKKPDFSGDWILVVAPGLGGGTATSTRPNLTNKPNVATSYASGAPFNCGTECTVNHTTNRLQLSRAAHKPVAQAEEVAFSLDGVTNRDGTTAKWDASTLVLQRPISGSLSATQSISLERERLKVVTSFNMPGFPSVTLEYERRK